MLHDRELIAGGAGGAAARRTGLAEIPGGLRGRRGRRRDGAPVRRSGLLQGRNTAAVRLLFAILAVATDGLAVIASALAAGILYHKGIHGATTPTQDIFQQGYILAILFVVPNLLRREYRIERYMSFRDHAGQVFTVWNVACMVALILAFLTKTSQEVSRGTAIVFYAGGIVALLGVRHLLVRIVRERVSGGAFAARRVFLVGYEEDVRAFSQRYEPWKLGMDVVASAVLRGKGSLNDDLVLAAASARVLKPEDIFVLVPWEQKDVVDACVNAFLRVPASIHLGPEKVLDRFRDIRIDHIGPVASLHLVRRPMSMLEVVQKRLFDLLVASAGLVALAPLFAIIAIAIKLDSRGPVFFLQRRYGFNQEPFRIFKFRSMTTMEDGRVVTQVRRNDPRVTRVGRFLRRYNLDELPQLLNVIRGDMSLVGPRPHALAHDQLYDQTIALYARRHNVKPGITGWAQVNGFRGETQGDERMRARVEHDLHYIDHWSLWLDIRILFLTVFSRKAYRNAV